MQVLTEEQTVLGTIVFLKKDTYGTDTTAPIVINKIIKK